MTKSELREIESLAKHAALGLVMQANIALALSALIRAARTNKSKAELMTYAQTFNVENHPDFVI